MQGHACGHHHANEADLSLGERLRQAEAICAKRGARLTSQRRLVLETLISGRKALGAYDLSEAVSRSTGRRTAPITIYRALDFLREMGLAHRIESRNTFLACPAGHGLHAPAAFLICDCCGRVEEAEASGLDLELNRLAAAHRFSTKARIIELAGHCSACSEGQ